MGLAIVVAVTVLLLGAPIYWVRRITTGAVVASRIEAATSAPPVRSVVVKLIYSDRSAKMASGVRPYHSSAFQLFEPAQPAGWRRCRRTPRRRNWLLAHLRAFTRHKQNRPVVSNAVCEHYGGVLQPARTKRRRPVFF